MIFRGAALPRAEAVVATPDYIKRLRSAVGHSLLFAPSVTAFVQRADGFLLVVKPQSQNGWTLPGGLVELDESPLDALVRETKEETGLEVVPTGVVGIFGATDGFQRTYGNGDELAYLDIVFECQATSAIPRPKDHEIQEAAFRPFADLYDWIYPISAAILRDASQARRIAASRSGAFVQL